MKDYLTKKSAYEQEYDEKYRQFDFDAEQDAIFRMQRKQLERERDDGVSDLLARYAANTGMAGSSAAMSAARDTSARYAGQITDALTNAEQTAYARWSADRVALEQKMADNYQKAMDEAERRLTLGDVSGYKELGYDTTEYEAKLERERREEEARIAAALAAATASKEKAENASKVTSPARGGNGMTEAEYKAEREKLLKQIAMYEKDLESPGSRKLISMLYMDMDRLDNAYFSTPRGYSDSEIEDIVAEIQLSENYVIPYSQYLALARYYADEGGEDFLAKAGITFSRGY